jgi:hypothetical protein
MTDPLRRALSNDRDTHQTTREAEHLVRAANERAKQIIQRMNEATQRQSREQRGR